LKRSSPLIVLLAATAIVVLLDAVVVMVPQALADPHSTATVSAPPLALAAPTAAPTPSPAPAGDFALPLLTFVPPTPAATPPPRSTSGPTDPPTPAPTYRDTVWNARAYVKNRVGAKGYDCVNAVWTGESKWNPLAGNPARAYGIPQAYPGSKMAAFGSNWRYSPLTQVKWGLWYINSRYGSACGAYEFWQNNGWY
jgi:hypothetical protein